MIIIFHNNKQVTNIIFENNTDIPFSLKKSISCTLLAVASQFPEALIVWCHELYKGHLNTKHIDKHMHHSKLMLSFNPSDEQYFTSTIGYVEQSPFINVNKSVRYPTWQMSSAVGAIYAAVLVNLKKVITPTLDFDYFLNSLAKLAMPKGLLCYSEPALLQGDYAKLAPKSSRTTLYKFVKQHYKLRWLFLLLLNELLYEKKFSFIPLIVAFFYTSKLKVSIILDEIIVESTLKTVETATIDVIIPTIGRKNYLYDVLCDIRNQTHLPKNVIIVEQNPLENSVSELAYLTSENWPFIIKHTFTHQAGACNARNIALQQVESEWVFLNDDDNRFEMDLLEKTLRCIKKYGVCALITSYLKSDEKLNYRYISQTSIFGSGNSFVKASYLKNVEFDMGFEFGYGEDSDFGMQLRNKGYDVIYFPNLKIEHLYAPIGGFRIKPILDWDGELIQPKPSPTIMLLKLKYDTSEQLQAYKTLLFIKYYTKQSVKNPFSYFKMMKNAWESSNYWAEFLIKKY
jgi:GT2 family glycosyltransferase